MQAEQATLPEGVTVRGTQGACYVVETLLGKGGFGAVYVVRDRRIRNKRFALKELIGQDKLDRECFLFEGELLKRLDHPALPHVYSVFEYRKSRRVYMLMDYVEGRNLNDLRKEQPEQRFTLPMALTVLAPIVHALIYLHHQDPPVIHRDIKPGNIIVTADGDGTKLVDFGAAKEYHSDATTGIVRQVTTGYAAPEQYMGGTNPRTDVYGLGATLFTLLTGQIPPDALVRATRSKGYDPLRSANLVLPTVPMSVVEIVRRAMSLSSDDRFETVEEFWQQLQAHAPQQQRSVSTLFSDLPSRSLLAHRPDKTLATHNHHSHSVSRLKRSFVLLAALLVLFFTASAPTGFLLRAVNAPAGQRHVSPGAPPVRPTPVTSMYPLLAASYNGTVGDLMTQERTDLFLTGIQQRAKNIHGSFQGLGLVNSFDGTVTPSGHVTFTVKVYDGAMTLVFEGQIKIGGDMAGSFAVLGEHGERTGESGLWNVASNSPL